MILWCIKRIFWLFWPVIPLSIRERVSAKIRKVQDSALSSQHYSPIEVLTYTEAAFLESQRWISIESVSVRQITESVTPPKFSIITTCYNEGGGVRQWLDSVALLELLPDEVVICDGGSSDDTLAQIHSWQTDQAKLPFELKVITGQKRNIAAGRNEAVRHASCEIILISDLGTVLHPHWSGRLVSAFADNPQLDAAFGWYEVNAESCTLSAKGLQSLFVLELEEVNPAMFLPSARSLAIKKSVIEELGGYPEQLTRAGEDTLFDLSLKKRGGSFAFVPEAYVFWQPPQDLLATTKTVLSYSKGDAEAGLFWGHYFQQLEKISMIVVDLTFALLLPMLFSQRMLGGSLILVIFAAYQVTKLLQPYYRRISWRSELSNEAHIALLSLIFVAAQSVGFLGGLRSGRKIKV